MWASPREIYNTKLPWQLFRDVPVKEENWSWQLQRPHKNHMRPELAGKQTKRMKNSDDAIEWNQLFITEGAYEMASRG